MHLIAENIKPIPYFKGYYITCLGAVLKKIGDNFKIIKARRAGRGQYLTVTIFDGNKWRNRRIHVLLLMSFVGLPPKKGMYGLHRDDNVLNNTLSNLRWGTQQDNMDDKVRNGTQATGNKIHTTIFSEQEIKNIRELCKTKSFREIAKQYHTCHSNIIAIHKRDTWKWVVG